MVFKISKIFVFALFCILLISNASAVVSYGAWSGDDAQSREITDGQSANFYVNFGSVNPPIEIDIKMYDSQWNLINVFENNKIVNSNTYSDIYSVTEQIYETPGDYKIVLTGSDNLGTQSHTIFLTVNPQPLQPNNPPVINSVPVTKVNETDNYAYQINATDADGDNLSYSLLQNPTWISINSAGFVSGTAPNLNFDTNFTITAEVSDGTNTTTQTWKITVLDISGNGTNQTNDTNAPAVNIVDPTNLVYNSNITGMNFTVSDAEGNLDSCWYSLDNGATNTTIPCNQNITGIISNEGINRWFVYANDTAGNVGFDSVVFIVDTSSNSGNNQTNNTNGNGDSKSDSKKTNYEYEDPDGLSFDYNEERPIIFIEEEKTPFWDKIKEFFSNWLVFIIMLITICSLLFLLFVLKRKQ